MIKLYCKDELNNSLQFAHLFPDFNDVSNVIIVNDIYAVLRRIEETCSFFKITDLHVNKRVLRRCYDIIDSYYSGTLFKGVSEANLYYCICFVLVKSFSSLTDSIEDIYDVMKNYDKKNITDAQIDLF